MNFKYNGYVYDDKFLDKLTESLNDIFAYHYNGFVNHKFGSSSIIDNIHLIEKNVTYDNTCPKQIGSKSYTVEKQKKLLTEFFSKFGLEEKVNLILNNKHPDYKTSITPSSPNQVGHRGYNEFISYEVNSKPNLEGCWLLAHEMGHALSNHHVKAMTLAKATNIAERNFGKNSTEFKTQRKVFREYTDNKQRNTVDCVGEIESHITEKLFMYYLLEKGEISKEDFNNYITMCTNTFERNLVLMIEENEIISKLHNPVTEQDCLDLYNKFKNTNHFTPLLDRIKIIAERKNNPDEKERRIHSKYVFRYVVGELVSTVWLNNYLNSNSLEQKRMLKHFVKYLGTSDKANLENVFNMVLGSNATANSTLTDYINFISNQQYSL